jgi:hypothetical protein
MLLDLGSHPLFGPAGSCLSSTYYAYDNLHLTTAGYAVIATNFAVALQMMETNPVMDNIVIPGNLAVSGNVANGQNTVSSGSFVLVSNTVPQNPGMGGGSMTCDGTNIIIVLQNGAGVRATNKVSLTSYP